MQSYRKQTRAMGTNLCIVACIMAISLAPAVDVFGADKDELRERRQRAAAKFHDGILLIHAKSAIDETAAGFREDPAFYYFTGLENTSGALLAIDGRSGESWLFVNPQAPFFKIQPPEVSASPAVAKQLGIEHVVDWTELEGFLAQRASSAMTLYYQASSDAQELPSNITGDKNNQAPLWLITIASKWPSFHVEEVDRSVSALMDVQSPREIVALRAAAKATVTAVMDGMRAIGPGVSQRSVEAVVENACWKAGAHGSSFWPWVMAGENAVFPRPFVSFVRYDHLNAVMHPGDLVRLDVGCEWEHYQGDLGRTVPVSGHYSDDQRETWNIFVAAYQAGAKSLRGGSTVDQVFDIWRAELLRHRESAKSDLARHAIDSWSQRENVRYWQLHTINLDAGHVGGPLRADTTIAFEPIASIDGQGFYLGTCFSLPRMARNCSRPVFPTQQKKSKRRCGNWRTPGLI